jgi:hypothetical protein
MKSGPTSRARLLAIIALLAVAGGGAIVLLNTKGTSNSVPPVLSTRTSSQATTRTTTTTRTTKTTRTTTSAKPKPKPKPKPQTSTSPAASDRVVALDAELVAHPVVVVYVYSPKVTAETEAMNEARAGAAAAGAGFVTFDVFDESQARALTTLIGSAVQVSNPEVLFFKRPRSLAFQLHGFVDSQVVAQEVYNLVPQTTAWGKQANAICARYSASLASATSALEGASADTASGRTKAAAALDHAAALLSKEVKELSAVKVNSASAASYANLLEDLRQASISMSSEAQALRRNDLAASSTIGQEFTTLVNSINQLAAELNLPSCAA